MKSKEVELVRKRRFGFKRVEGFRRSCVWRWGWGRVGLGRKDGLKLFFYIGYFKCKGLEVNKFYFLVVVFIWWFIFEGFLFF